MPWAGSWSGHFNDCQSGLLEGFVAIGSSQDLMNPEMFPRQYPAWTQSSRVSRKQRAPAANARVSDANSGWSKASLEQQLPAPSGPNPEPNPPVESTPVEPNPTPFEADGKYEPFDPDA